MKIEVIIALILMALLMSSCNNSTVNFSWKSVVEAPTVDTRGNVDMKPSKRDNVIRPETEVQTTVTPEGSKEIVKELIQ